MRLIILLVQIFLILPVQVQAQNGDIAFWLPQTGGDSEQEFQIKRNDSYFSIKLHSVFAYYKSSFLENIKKLIVVSDTTLSEDNKTPIQSTMINKAWQKLDDNGDFIGVNDHLVTLSPATESNIKINISFRGIGEDQFNLLFETLSDPTLKTALSLSPVTSATISAIAPTIQKLLASPYTENDPRHILDISQSYIVYADTIQLKSDSLREGYLVIISSREGKSADLDKVSQDTKNIRLSPSGVGLQYLDGTEWKQFRNNSYVVLSVTKTPYRGENESSNWFAKYTEAERTAEEKLVGGQPTDKVKPEVIGLWTEGNALLFADPNYLQNERNLIKNKHFKALQDVFLAKGDASKAKLDSNALGVAPNYADLALKYENAAAKQSAQITISAIDLDGNPLQNARISLTDFNSSSNKGVISTTTNDHGEAVFKGVSPGKYKIKGDFGGFVVHGVGYPYNELPDKGVSVETGAFIVDPKDKLHITVHRMLKENGLTSE